MTDIVQLRGHHLLCILTYIGMGYTPEFIANMDLTVARINQGAEIEIVNGIDTICAALHSAAAVACEHARVCRQKSVRDIDRVALLTVAHILQFPHLKAGDRLKLGKGEITYLRQHFLQNSNRRACEHCPWFEECTRIASTGYQNTQLQPNAVPS